jgi:hypothetical protein
MTATTLVIARAVHPASPGSTRTLSATLRAIHRHWMSETWQWLAPTLSPDADFWNGWSAVRYLNDQFQRLYRHQCALLTGILPLLSRSDTVQIRAATEVLAETLHHLDRIGRRLGMTESVAALSGRFLDLLGVWFAEIQRVTRELTRDELPPQGQQALRQLEGAIAIRGDQRKPYWLSGAKVIS